MALSEPDHGVWFHGVVFVCAAALSLSGLKAAAQDATFVPALDARVGPARDSFAAHWSSDKLLRPAPGVSVEPVYYGEVFTNAHGGKSTNDATRHLGLLDLPLTVNFEELGAPVSGRFFLLAQHTYGQGLTEEFVGDAQVLSNIDPFANITQVSQYWWETSLLDGALRWRLGKQDVNTDFLLMPSASDFIHSAFGLSPSAGLPSYPDPGMATVLLAELTESTTAKVGVWDALGDGGTWGVSGNDVVLSLAELECRYSLARGRLPGTIALGAVHISSGVAGGERVPTGYGGYVQLEQWVFVEPMRRDDDSGPRQGLTVFAQYALSQYRGTLPFLAIPEDAVMGVTCIGLLPGRDEDVCGAGIAWARLDRGGTRHETAMEVFYKVQVTESMSLQPDLQYIFTPSGLYPDALVFGLRVQQEF